MLRPPVVPFRYGPEAGFAPSPFHINGLRGRVADGVTALLGLTAIHPSSKAKFLLHDLWKTFKVVQTKP